MAAVGLGALSGKAFLSVESTRLGHWRAKNEHQGWRKPHVQRPCGENGHGCHGDGKLKPSGSGREWNETGSDKGEGLRKLWCWWGQNTSSHLCPGPEGGAEPRGKSLSPHLPTLAISNIPCFCLQSIDI